MQNGKKFFDKFVGSRITGQDASDIFAAFDANKDNVLDRDELLEFLRCLATSGEFKDEDVEKIFKFLDKDKDGSISKSDFLSNGAQLLTVSLSSRVGLIIVDVQNDFISGSLALSGCPANEDGAEVVPVINQIVRDLANHFTTIVYSLDWHPEDHISFVDNLSKRRLAASSQVIESDKAQVGDVVVLETQSYGSVEQKLWPRHCVQNSHGAELHKDLELPRKYYKVLKGMDPDIDSYSAFWDNGKRKKTDLHQHLRSHNVQDLLVCGLATDVCVGATAAHAQEYGYRTALIDDASRGVLPDDIRSTRSCIQQRAGIVAKSTQLQQLVNKRERPAAWITAAVDAAAKLL